MTTSEQMRRAGWNSMATEISRNRSILSLEAPAQFALLKEAVVMAHQQMGFHLPHRI
jgi:hypothetical protein